MFKRRLVMRSAFLILSLFLFFTILADKKDFYAKLNDAALYLTTQKVVYDPSYFRLDYPGGDVPKGKGVCTDVVIRAYRKLGIVVNKRSKDGKRYQIVHNIGAGQVLEDMLFNFKIIGHYRYKK